ncbi:MAG TPA: carboxypeptidase-like regulatory domain-containing protein [Pyrinomonadaceae bacterium]|nr:carboxypeptidase-like regulatory domain-containing protein [Pyrinomonadaceae bacterium]
MSYTELLEPILRGGIRSVNFFNGRLLSAEDLKQEQDANREGRARLGQAVGHGVAYGLEVALSAANTAQTPVVTVGAGLAVNREGRALKLTAAADIALVQQPSDEGASAGQTFKDCRTTQGGVYLTGAGVYLLTVAPAEGPEGRAPFSGLGETVVTCNTRYRVEGVRFRLVRLLTSNQLGTNLNTLRSRVAYECLGAEALRNFEKNPLAAPLSSYGLLDSKRPAQLADDEVPLAVVYWATTGIGFVDNWSVRRPVTRRAPSERFEPLAGDRRYAEALAAFFQFQEQLAAIQSNALVGDTTVLKADDHFAFLPPAGLLPAAGTRGFDWRKFLGPHAPPSETYVDEGLLRSLVESSLPLDPVKISPFAAASNPGSAPPAPYAVYAVQGSSDFVLFARSPRGRVRVFISPPNAPVTAGQVYVEEIERGNLRLYAKVVAGSGLYPVVGLESGSYLVSVNAPGVITDSKSGVQVVEGRTTDISFTVTTPGRLLLTVNEAKDHTNIGGKVEAVTLTPEKGGTPLHGTKVAGDKWLVDNVTAGKYTVRVTADGYVAGELAVEIVVAETTQKTIELQPVPVTTGLINMEVRSALTQARIDSAVTRVTTTLPSGATLHADRGGDGIWSFIDIPAGTYDIKVEATNYTADEVEGVTIAPAEVKIVAVALEPFKGRILLNFVDNNTGAHIDTVVNSVSASDGTTTVEGTLVGSRWQIEVPPGTWEVRAGAPNYLEATKGNVQVAVAGEVIVPVVLDPLPGTVSLAINWVNRVRIGNFEAVLTPGARPALAPVSFIALNAETDAAAVTNVPAGGVRVVIREKIPNANNPYPETAFNVVVPPAGTASRTVGLPLKSIMYYVGEPRPGRRFTWSLSPADVESPPSINISRWPNAAPEHQEVLNWLTAWRNWLVLTRPDLGLDPDAAPHVAIGISSQDRHNVRYAGGAVFFRPGNSRVGIPVNVHVAFV